MLAFIFVVRKSWLRPCFRPPQRQEPSWRSWFFLLVWLWWVKNCGCLPLDTSIGGVLVDLIFPKSFSSFFAGLYSQEYFKSISRVLEDGCSNAFASISTAFLIASSHKSSSPSRAFNCTRIEDLRISQKYGIKISLFGVEEGSNSCRTACKYSRYAAQLRTFSHWYWESLLIFL